MRALRSSCLALALLLSPACGGPRVQPEISVAEVTSASVLAALFAADGEDTLERWQERCASFATEDCRRERAELLVDLGVLRSAAAVVDGALAQRLQQELASLAEVEPSSLEQVLHASARLAAEDLAAVGASPEEIMRARIFLVGDLLGDEGDEVFLGWSEERGEAGARARVAVAARSLASARTWTRLGSSEAVGASMVADCGFLCSLERGRSVEEAALLLGWSPEQGAAADHLDEHLLLALGDLLRRLEADREAGVRVVLGASFLTDELAREVRTAAVPASLPLALVEAEPALQLPEQLFSREDSSVVQMSARPALRLVLVRSDGVRVALLPHLRLGAQGVERADAAEEGRWSWPGARVLELTGSGALPASLAREESLPALREALQELGAQLDAWGWPIWKEGSVSARSLSLLADRETPWKTLAPVLRTLVPFAVEGLILHVQNEVLGQLGALPVQVVERVRPGAVRVRVRRDGLVVEHASLGGAHLIPFVDGDPLLALHRALEQAARTLPELRVDVVPDGEQVDLGLICRALELASWQREAETVRTDVELLRAPVRTDALGHPLARSASGLALVLRPW